MPRGVPHSPELRAQAVAAVLSGTDTTPMRCEHPGCQALAEQWCPTCEQLLCAYHDERAPERRHGCLVDTAETPPVPNADGSEQTHGLGVTGPHAIG